MTSSLAVLALTLAACGGGEPLFELYEPELDTPERLAWDAGIVKYLGTAKPREERVLDNGDITYEFDAKDGPQCLRGRPYRTTVRDTESEDLLIFLQGGGACWSDFCLAVTSAPAGIATGANLLDADLEANPYADFDIVYLPYCDGSLFAGDRDVPEDDPAKIAKGHDTRRYRGLANLSAALTMSYKHFPRPRRVVLAGSSGGGYGTILASYLVRYVYPGVPIEVVNDAGIGLGKEGDQAFLDKLISEFGAEAFIPDECVGCLEGGHILGLVTYLLERDPDIRVAAISSWFDFVISELFLGIDPLVFQDAMATRTQELHERFPDQYRRFIYDGAGHTAVLGNVTGIVGSDLLGGVELPSEFGTAGFAGLQILSIDCEPDATSCIPAQIGDVTLSDWLFAMSTGDDEGWADLTATPTLPEP